MVRENRIKQLQELNCYQSNCLKRGTWATFNVTVCYIDVYIEAKLDSWQTAPDGVFMSDTSMLTLTLLFLAWKMDHSGVTVPGWGFVR